MAWAVTKTRDNEVQNEWRESNEEDAIYVALNIAKQDDCPPEDDVFPNLLRSNYICSDLENCLRKNGCYKNGGVVVSIFEI